MAYFQKHENDREHTRLFQAPVPQDDPWSDEDETYGESYVTVSQEEYDEIEAHAEREDRFRMLSGISNLAGVILGTLAILATLALLISLISWVVNDMTQSFSILEAWF